MLEVVFTVCQIKAADVCQTIRERVDLEVTKMLPMQCDRNAQIIASKWIDKNPGWRVTRYGCGRPSKDI